MNKEGKRRCPPIRSRDTVDSTEGQYVTIYSVRSISLQYSIKSIGIFFPFPSPSPSPSLYRDPGKGRRKRRKKRILCTPQTMHLMVERKKKIGQPVETLSSHLYQTNNTYGPQKLELYKQKKKNRILEKKGK